MPNGRAVPKGYMTVGGLAKRMGVTVRTLQYYDREGVLSPSAESEGGRRLYTDKDMIKLHQVLSLKSLGFSLDDIKNRLSSLDTPADVAEALAGQADAIREKIAGLSEALGAIEALKAEVLQMQRVDFGKYADIIVNLQMGNAMYGLIKHFDSDTMDHIRNRFDRESGMAFMEAFQRLCDTAIRYRREGIEPGSGQGRALAGEFWRMVLDFMDGDMSMLPKLTAFAGQLGGSDQEWAKKQAEANAFIEPALEAYFAAEGGGPFKEGTT